MLGHAGLVGVSEKYCKFRPAATNHATPAKRLDQNNQARISYEMRA